MQELLTIVIVLSALAYLVYFIYQQTFAKKKKCDGCAINKIYRMKMEREAKSGR
ncbi:MAG: hypothetical protein IT223_11565 [Crocinitomicaceae bacterium]|nr:hypothetical protein [Crocinitomicaceae bacterium]